VAAYVGKAPIEANEMLALLTEAFQRLQRGDDLRVADGKMPADEAARRAAVMQRAKLTLARYGEREEAFRLYLKWEAELADCIKVLEGKP